MENFFAAAKLVDVDGFFVRIIPSAKDIFSIPKLNMTRNNIHNSKNGLYLCIYIQFLLDFNFFWYNVLMIDC
jgi:hypothetical protein